MMPVSWPPRNCTINTYMHMYSFTGTINAFEGERRDDRLKAFDVDKASLESGV